MLSDVLAALDIEGTPDDVVITDMDYLTAEKINGVWYLTTSNPDGALTDAGKLKINIGGTETTIKTEVGQESLSVIIVPVTSGYLYFDKSGGEGELNVTSEDRTETDKMFCMIGSTYKLPDCPYTRAGYSFAGWEIKLGEENYKIYAPGALYTHNSRDNTAKALWKDDTTQEIINLTPIASVSVSSQE